MRSDTYIRDLSKGNKTRVGIVGALIGNPEVLIFDEPFSSLDPSSQMQLRELFIQLNKEGKTLLISSHDLEHVSEVANRILIIKSGEITGDLTGAEIDLSKLRSYFIDEVKQEDAAIIEASQSSSESKSEGEENE